MHVMLVNDDGIFAFGIRVLCKAAAEAGHRVSVCAPNRERSAVSHAITMSEPIHIQEVEMPYAEVAYACDGTPSDCARLGLFLLKDVDVVLSGVNNGANLGGSCIYSGTINAALEASMSGVPAIAVSSCAYMQEDYSAPSKVAMRVLDWMWERPLPRGSIYSLNVPCLPYEQIRGVRAATLAPLYLDEPNYRAVCTENGVEYHFANGKHNIEYDDPINDRLLCDAGYATLTKLTWDMRLNAPAPDTSEILL